MEHPRITTASAMVSDRKGAFALFAGLFFLVITIAGYAGLYYINKSQDATQSELVAQIQQKEEDLRPKLLDQIFALQKRIQTVSAVLTSHIFVANTFAALERDTHPRVRFQSYAFSPTDNTITLKGEAGDYSVLAQQIAFLEGDQQIDRVEFGGLSLADNNRVSFNLTIRFLPTFTATRR